VEVLWLQRAERQLEILFWKILMRIFVPLYDLLLITDYANYTRIRLHKYISICVYTYIVIQTCGGL